VRVQGRWGWETAVFRCATAIALVHALDDAFVHRQPGVDPGQHALAAVISLTAGVAAIVGFPRLRPGFRAAISIGFGVFAIVNGGLHVQHISVDGAAGSDYTGVLAVAAGAVLVALGVAIPFLHAARVPRRRAGAGPTASSPWSADCSLATSSSSQSPWQSS
jgi:hypothetical protein